MQFALISLTTCTEVRLDLSVREAMLEVQGMEPGTVGQTGYGVAAP